MATITQGTPFTKEELAQMGSTYNKIIGKEEPKKDTIESPDIPSTPSTPSTPPPSTVDLSSRTLPTVEEEGEETQISNFRNAINQIMRKANSVMSQEKPVTIEALKAMSGGAPLSPDIINTALKNNIQSRQESIRSISETGLSTMSAAIMDRVAKRKENLTLAFDDNVLRTGIMPSNLPNEYKELWQMASQGFVKGENQLTPEQKLRAYENLNNPKEWINSVESGTMNNGKVVVGNKKAGIAIRNNNPLNLTYVGQTGATRGEPKLDNEGNPTGSYWAKFATLEDGWEAGKRDLTIKTTGNSPHLGQPQDTTLMKLISVYAPSNENDVVAYTNFVSQQTGYSPDTTLDKINVDKLTQAMALYESGSYREEIVPDVKGDDKADVWDTAAKFIEDNPETSDSMIKAELLKRDLGLSLTEINSLLETRPRTRITNDWITEQFSQEQIEEAIKNSPYAGFLKKREKEIQNFYKALDEANITLQVVGELRRAGYEDDEILNFIVNKIEMFQEFKEEGYSDSEISDIIRRNVI
ncbi:MAG: hypothetical protein K9L99_06055 [Candidatus Omnitrophica bacterium]|nr:hypothetical protein [Candidatus Omnitrophota bacterium]